MVLNSGILGCTNNIFKIVKLKIITEEELTAKISINNPNYSKKLIKDSIKILLKLDIIRRSKNYFEHSQNLNYTTPKNYYKNFISLYIKKEKPTWVFDSTNLKILDLNLKKHFPNEHSILNFCDLLRDNTKNRDWWKKFMIKYQKNEDEKHKKEIGDKGELLVFKYLRKLSKNKSYPKHISKIDDSAGYDIINKNDNIEELIEVKTTELSSEEVVIHISRNEMLVGKKNNKNYYLYIVSNIKKIKNKPQKLTIVPIKKIIKHIDREIDNVKFPTINYTISISKYKTIDI